jgi:hypothetical protein
MNGFEILMVADVAGMFLTATEHPTQQHEPQAPQRGHICADSKL